MEVLSLPDLHRMPSEPPTSRQRDELFNSTPTFFSVGFLVLLDRHFSRAAISLHTTVQHITPHQLPVAFVCTTILRDIWQRGCGTHLSMLASCFCTSSMAPWLSFMGTEGAGLKVRLKPDLGRDFTCAAQVQREGHRESRTYTSE